MNVCISGGGTAAAGGAGLGAAGVDGVLGLGALASLTVFPLQVGRLPKGRVVVPPTLVHHDDRGWRHWADPPRIEVGQCLPVFSPGIWWSGFTMNRSGCAVQVLQVNS